VRSKLGLFSSQTIVANSVCGSPEVVRLTLRVAPGVKFCEAGAAALGGSSKCFCCELMFFNLPTAPRNRTNTDSNLKSGETYGFVRVLIVFMLCCMLMLYFIACGKPAGHREVAPRERACTLGWKSQREAEEKRRGGGRQSRKTGAACVGIACRNTLLAVYEISTAPSKSSASTMYEPSA